MVDNVTDANAVDAGVVHYMEVNALVVAIASTATAMLKATVVLAGTLISEGTAMRFWLAT